MSAGSSETPKKIELLSAWFCPYAQRAWIAMEEKCPGEFSLTESMKIVPPTFFEKTKLLMEKNPKAQVPVIIDKRGDTEEVVYESLVCVEFVDEAMGDGKPMLLPGPPSQRAHARIWANKLDNVICTQFYHLIMNQDKVLQRAAAENILSGLREFSKHCKGPFFYGEELSIVDIVIAPWVVGVRMDVLKHYRAFEIPRTAEYDKYWEWAGAIRERPSFIATDSNDLPAMIDVYLPYARGTGYCSVESKEVTEKEDA